MQLFPLTQELLLPAAALFAAGYGRQREAVPAAPERMQNPALAASKLEWLLEHHAGLAVVEDGQLLAYLGWMLLDDFRDTGVKAAYCPEWAHAAPPGQAQRLYRALYREAAQIWQQSGCLIHALTLLEHDRQGVETWFWNGFGLGTVDAVRPIHAIEAPVPLGFELRPAQSEDRAAVSAIDTEHCQHYSKSPVYMVPPAASSSHEVQEFIQRAHNRFWLAWDGEQIAAMLKFEHRSFGAASIVAAEDSIAITGAYTRPAYRGRGLLPALLDAGLRQYAREGFQRCSVDFEAFNPEAAHFWMKYFQPVAYSLFRVPEQGLAALAGRGPRA